MWTLRFGKYILYLYIFISLYLIYQIKLNKN